MTNYENYQKYEKYQYELNITIYISSFNNYKIFRNKLQNIIYEYHFKTISCLKYINKLKILKYNIYKIKKNWCSQLLQQIVKIMISKWAVSLFSYFDTICYAGDIKLAILLIF